MIASMPDRDPKLMPAEPSDIAGSVTFALMFSGKKRYHNNDRLTAEIAARHIVEHLDWCGFVALKPPPIGGSAPEKPPPGYPRTKPEDMR
jgi:hypothetical protein